MTQSTLPINTKLVESLAQIILSLSDEERLLLSQKVHNPNLTQKELQVKLTTLQQDINLGINQLNEGNYTDYDQFTLHSLLNTIKQKGQQRLNKETME